MWPSLLFCSCIMEARGARSGAGIKGKAPLKPPVENLALVTALHQLWRPRCHDSHGLAVGLPPWVWFTSMRIWLWGQALDLHQEKRRSF